VLVVALDTACAIQARVVTSEAGTAFAGPMATMAGRDGRSSDGAGPAVESHVAAPAKKMITMAEMERRIASGVVPWTPPDLRPTIKQLTTIYKRPPMIVEVHPSLPPLTINIQRIEDIGDSCGFRSVIALCGGACISPPLSHSPQPLHSLQSHATELQRHTACLPLRVRPTSGCLRTCTHTRAFWMNRRPSHYMSAGRLT
jgi:hypothetical protein